MRLWFSLVVGCRIIMCIACVYGAKQASSILVRIRSSVVPRIRVYGRVMAGVCVDERLRREIVG